MRVHAVLVTTCLAGTAALGGCADIPFTDDTFTLSNAASMRVEVEVYKGPLSKTLPVQWGELEGLVDTAVVLLGDFAEVICRTIDRKNPKSTDNGEDRSSISSGCGNDSDTAISVHQSVDIGDQILRGMHADAQRLKEEAERLREVVRSTRPGSPGCHINQALEALGGSTVGPCPASAVQTANKSANEAIGDAAKALQIVEAAVEAIDKGENKVQEAATDASMYAEVARTTIVSPKTNLQDAVEAIGKSENKLQEVRDAAGSVAEGNEKVRSTAATAGASVNIVKESIDGAGTHLEAALNAAENVRTAAGKANESVLNARVRTEAAESYVRRRSLIDVTRAAGDTLRKRLHDLADRLDGLRDAIAEAGDYATQGEVPEIDASGLRDTLEEIHEALREAENLADASKQAHGAQIGAFNRWRTALSKIEDPAGKFIVEEAEKFFSLAVSSASTLDSALSTVSEIASEVQSMQAEPTEVQPLDELKVHLANARDHGLRLKEAKLRDPIQEIQHALSAAKNRLAGILLSDDDTRTVREAAGLTKEEKALPADITKPLDTYHADAAELRGLRHDHLEATHSSLEKARSAASELAMAGSQRALIALTAQLDRVLNQASRLRRVPDEYKIDQYVKTLQRAGTRLRTGTTNEARVDLDKSVKENHKALSALYKALDEAEGHLAAVVGTPRVPSLETRTQLHADLVKLVGLAEEPSLKSRSELLHASTRPRVAAWRRRLVAMRNELERNLATIAELRTRVADIENKVGLLAAQLEENRPSLDDAVTALSTAQTNTNRLSEAANEGISDTPWDGAAREHVVRRIGDLGMRLKTKAFYWAEIHTALAPCCRDVRIAMAGFANLASELSNHLESRADALQWQLDEEYGTDARELPLSLYLRDAQPTDFLNLYTWNRAAAPALLADMVWHPWNAFSSDETADRVRVIERLFADHNWGKINTVYGSGQGDFAMALVKDDIGNWSLKSFEADPTKLVKAYTDLTLAALTKTRRKITGSDLPRPELLRLTGSLAAGRIGDTAGPFDVFDTERLHERVVEELKRIRNDAVKTRDEREARHDESARKVVESEATARSAEARAKSAPVKLGPNTCVAPASCPVEATLAKAQEAKTEAFKAEISVRDLKQGTSEKAASTAETLAGAAVSHASEAETKVADIPVAPVPAEPDAKPPDTPPAPTEAKPTQDAAKEAHLLAEKARAFAAAATAWAAHADAIVEQEKARADLRSHRAQVSERVRDVLNDYAAVIATLLESRVPSDSSVEIMDEAQKEGNDDR